MIHRIIIDNYQHKMNEVMHTNYAEHLSFVYQSSERHQTTITKQKALEFLDNAGEFIVFDMQAPLDDIQTLEFLIEANEENHIEHRQLKSLLLRSIRAVLKAKNVRTFN